MTVHGRLPPIRNSASAKFSVIGNGNSVSEAAVRKFGSVVVRCSVSRNSRVSSTYQYPVRNHPTTGFGMGSVSADRKNADRKLFTLLKLSGARSVRAWDSESLGRRFKSYRAHQTHRNPIVMAFGPRDRSPLVQSVRLFYQR